jgi:hypothetical protein
VCSRGSESCSSEQNGARFVAVISTGVAVCWATHYGSTLPASTAPSTHIRHGTRNSAGLDGPSLCYLSHEPRYFERLAGVSGRCK